MSLIKTLSSDLKPFQSMERLPVFLSKKFLPVLLLFVALSFVMVGQKEILGIRWSQAVFLLKNSLWIAAALASFVAFYQSCFPQHSSRLPGVVTALSILGLIVLEILQLDVAHIHREFDLEMDLFRGGCGVIISLMSIGYWWVLKNWAKQGAPRSPAMTGLWASISASAAGCILMQAVCWQQGSLHILLWHFLPMTLACYAGPMLAKKWLRW